MQFTEIHIEEATQGCATVHGKSPGYKGAEEIGTLVPNPKGELMFHFFPKGQERGLCFQTPFRTLKGDTSALCSHIKGVVLPL
jgi:hypothetical protein